MLQLQTPTKQLPHQTCGCLTSISQLHPKALLVGDEDPDGMNDADRPGNRQQRQAKGSKAEQPDQQVQPELACEAHLGGNSPGGKMNAKTIRRISQNVISRAQDTSTVDTDRPIASVQPTVDGTVLQAQIADLNGNSR
jgi:hypothetical protein